MFIVYSVIYGLTVDISGYASVVLPEVRLLVTGRRILGFLKLKISLEIMTEDTLRDDQRSVSEKQPRSLTH